MSKHTPGPWFPTKISDYNEVARIGRAWNISTMLALADFGDVDADARLIAAAPDLLEALKSAVAAMEPHMAGDGYLAVRVGLARAAISKATGEKA